MTKEPAKTAPKDLRELARPAGILLAICAAVAVLLVLTHSITAPVIDRLQWEKTSAAMARVLPAEVYDKGEPGLQAPHVTAFYFAYDLEDGTTAIPVGYVVETSASGFQGDITMMVGVDMEGAVTGVFVTGHKEINDLGAKVVADQSVLGRFTGMSHENGEITVNAGANRVDGVSGATISFQGVAEGVNAALDAVAAFGGKEG